MGKKIYHIKVARDGREARIASGTLDELKRGFSYTLEIGASWDAKVNRDPKTMKSFVSALRKAFAAKEACCYQRTMVEQVESAEAK